MRRDSAGGGAGTAARPAARVLRLSLVQFGVVAAAVLTGSTAALVFGSWSFYTGTHTDVLSTVSMFLAAGCCWWTARAADGASRWCWTMFGTAVTMWTAADVAWFANGLGMDVVGMIPAANALYLVGLGPIVAGLLFYPVGTWERGAGLRLVLDVLVLSSALMLVTQLLVLREVADGVGSTWEALVLGVYPVTDLVMAGLATLLVLRSVGRPPLDLVLIALAFVTWATADNGYALLTVRGTDTTVTTVALAYVVAPALLGLAALNASISGSQVRTVQRNATGTLAALLPDVAALGAAVLCIALGLDGLEDWALAGVTLTLTAIRQVVLTSDNHGLRQSLERRVSDRTEELQHLADRHERILDSVGEGIFGVDGRGAISFVNPAAAQMLGWAPSDLLGRNACEALCTRQHDSCPLNLVLNVGDVATHGETEYARRDGTRLPVAITAAPNLAADGGRGAVVVFRDISDRHVVDLMKAEFVSAVSHELRTPLTAIRGSLELLADGAAGVLPPGAHEIIALAERGSERLARLVNDIIDMERLEVGSFSVEPTAQEIEPLIRTSVNSLRALADQAQVRLVVGQAHGRAMCDADRVVQAVVNLVGNALKFTAPGGAVRVSAVPTGREITVSISDEGRGIPADKLESIF